MSTLLILLLIGIVGYLGSRIRNAAERLESLERRLRELEWQLSNVKQSATKMPFSGAPAAPASPSVSNEALFESTSPPPTASLRVLSIPEPSPSPGSTITPPPAAPPILAETPAPSPSWHAPTRRAPLMNGGNSGSVPTVSAPPPRSQPIQPLAQLNWEQFMGVKLFAWIGGFALFLGVAFFIKYSFERNLIPPAVRVAVGFVTGIALLIGGVLMKRREFAVTSHTLCATGVVILYTVTFACRSIYHFSAFGPFSTFALMTLITVAAFTLAVRLDALVVAILGLVGGFLTPVLLSTGTDNPIGLFTYIALLDAGLLAVAFRRRWYFLPLMGAAGTVLIQLAWVAKFFVAEKVFTALAVFLGFDLLFCLAFLLAEKRKDITHWFAASAIGLSITTLGFAVYLLSFESLGLRPGVVFSFVLGADLCLMAIVLARPALHEVHLMAGTAAFMLLAGWTLRYLTPPLLFWALGLYLGFAALHTLFPVALTRLRPESRRVWWGQLFPPLALLLVLLPVFKIDGLPLVVWPVVLLIDLLAIGAALLSASIALIVAVLFLTGLVTAVWLMRIPPDLTELPALLTVIGGFALFFFAAGIFARARLSVKRGELGLAPGEEKGAFAPNRAGLWEDLEGQVPALSAILPFVLLIMVVARLPLANPSPVFGLAMLLVVALLGLGLISRMDALAPVSMVCVLALQYLWHEHHFTALTPWTPLLWSIAFYAVYTIYPFSFRARLGSQILPWAASALAGPLHFYLVHRAVSLAFPNFAPGLLPAMLAIPMLIAMAHVARSWPEGAPARLNLLAWFGGSALFFITLIFPVQFDRQWITIGWALEGVALIWLFHRVPHPGLRATGVVLLGIAFVRLALNPAVLAYHSSDSGRVLNWYLYAYGSVTLCLLFGARLLAPPRNRVWNLHIPPVLYTLGTILAFLLVNIEIADYFSDGEALTFQFSGNLPRDMTYSVAWAIFALVLLIVGIWKRQATPRYAAIGLLFLTLLKLFFHDLSRLGQLYRIGAFVIVAIILILASFLYQRFVSFDASRRT